MLIYYILLGYIIVVSLYFMPKFASEQKRKMFFLLIFLPLWLIMGLRYGVGADYFSYKNIFDVVKVNGIDAFAYIEFGYILLNYIVGKLTSDSIYIFLVTSFVIVYFFMRTFWEHSINIMLSLVLFVSLGYYFNAMNAVRQFMAIAIAFYAIKYINKDSWWRFLIYVVIASTFHKSVLIVIMSYIAIVFFKDKLFFVLSFFVFAGINYFGPVVLNFASQNYWLRKYITFAITESRISYFNIALGLVTFIIGYFVYTRLEKDNEMLIYLKYNWVALLSFMFLYKWGSACTRVAFYYTPVYLLIIPKVVRALKGWKVRFYVQIVLFAICGIYLMNMLVNSVQTGNDFIPYVMAL